MFKLGTIILTLLLTTSAFSKNKVVYGVDNRVEVYQTESTLYSDLAKSTAAMIDSRSLNKDEATDTYTITGGTLESRGICSNARFSQQITAASCSGFLVGPNLLVTAGHCITSDYDCQNQKWVFDYKQNEEESVEFTTPASNVFSCKRIIQRALDRGTRDDFALIELDREVSERTPLEFRKEGKVEDNAPLVVIGHPSGLPTKIADGANVRNNYDEVFFSANLDTFGGNSGSAVFNSETGLVEGILVRGEVDYVVTSRGCRLPKVCSEEGCRGEDVTRITNITDLMNSYELETESEVVSQ
jgi:V8-like Glu-specific endopeptidase